MPSGLDFPGNQVAVNDIRLIWDGSNLLPRVTHTAIWRYYPRQHTGYYAVAWHSPNGGQGTWDSGEYSYGTHPYPAANGSVDQFGVSTTPAGSDGTIHWWEIAGAGFALDYLTSAGGTTGLQVVKDKWYVQVRRARQLGNGSFEYRFIPDLTGNPDFEIVHVDTAALGTSGANPAFYIGASDWQSGLGGSGSTSNNECPSGIVRGIQLYSTWLSNGDAIVEAGNDTSNSPLTVSGAAYKWYINQNPTSADVTDKSGAGHNPRWDNSIRPALWTSADSGTVVSVNVVSGSYSVLTPSILYGSTIVSNVISGTFSTTSIDFARVFEVSSFSRRLKL